MNGHSEEDGDRDLVSKERAGARRYSARQCDRLCPAGFSGSSLNFSDGRFTYIDVLHDFRLKIHPSGDAESRR